MKLCYEALNPNTFEGPLPTFHGTPASVVLLRLTHIAVRVSSVCSSAEQYSGARLRRRRVHSAEEHLVRGQCGCCE